MFTVKKNKQKKKLWDCITDKGLVLLELMSRAYLCLRLNDGVTVRAVYRLVFTRWVSASLSSVKTQIPKQPYPD